MKLPTPMGRSTVYVFAEYDEYWAETAEGDEIYHRRGDAAEVINKASKYIQENVEPYRLGKGTVLIAEGVYEVKTPIILRDGIHIKGMGKDVTVFREAEQGVEVFTGYDENNNNIILNSGSLSDLSVESNRLTTGGALIRMGVNSAGNVNSYTIENVGFYGGAVSDTNWDRVYAVLYGTEDETKEGLTLINCTFDFSKFGRTGINKELRLENSNITLIGCKVIDAYIIHGWDLYRPAARNISWIGCTILDTIVRQPSSRDPRANDIYFVGCKIRKINRGQVWIDEAAFTGHFAFIGCQIDAQVSTVDGSIETIVGCKLAGYDKSATLGGGNSVLLFCANRVESGKLFIEEVSKNVISSNILRGSPVSLQLDTASGWPTSHNVIIGNYLSSDVYVVSGVGLVNNNLIMMNVSENAKYTNAALPTSNVIGSLTPGGDKTSNRMIVTLSGDGTTTDFLAGTHGLASWAVAVPRSDEIVAVATPISQDAINSAPITAYLSDEDADNIKESVRVKFATAPPAGTDNIKIVIDVRRAQPI